MRLPSVAHKTTPGFAHLHPQAARSSYSGRGPCRLCHDMRVQIYKALSRRPQSGILDECDHPCSQVYSVRYSVHAWRWTKACQSSSRRLQYSFKTSGRLVLLPEWLSKAADEAMVPFELRWLLGTWLNDNAIAENVMFLESR